MELEDLKTTWKFLGNEIEHIARNSKEEIIINKNQDIKTGLINRFRWGAVMLIVGTCLLSTSRLWAYTKMPIWWLCAFCLLFIFGIIATFRLIAMVRKINLGEDSHVQVMAQILSIKKFYRNIELYGCTMILILMVCGILFSPIPYSTIEIIFISAMTLVCFLIEYLWYKSNVKKFNNMQNWLE